MEEICHVMASDEMVQPDQLDFDPSRVFMDSESDSVKMRKKSSRDAV